MVFQKEVHEYVLANYKHPSDITDIVKELEGPLPQLMKQNITLRKLKDACGIDLAILEMDLTEDNNNTVDNLEELLLQSEIFLSNASPRCTKTHIIYTDLFGASAPRR